jgi:flagellar M-ring protein FliF
VLDVLARPQVAQLWSNLSALGTRKLAALVVVGVATFSAIAIGGHYLGRPDYETLYVGLSQPDVARMGAALTDHGILFDVSADGAKIMVRVGETARARALLAEKGLPSGGTSGYELFDKLGAIGLTSFAQEVTRARALEGELTRTILSLKGIRAARVHLVLPEQGPLRRNRQTPSASVVVRTEAPGDAAVGAAIRHLVAAAVPGLAGDQVRVLGTDGAILAAGAEAGGAMSLHLIEFERKIARDLQDNIRRTLAPFLGHENFEVSAAVRLNVDKRKIDETAYDPESKVERSTRVVKESGNAQNAGNRSTVSVERNIPADASAGQSPDVSRKSNERREEVTNFEVNSRSTSTVSEGYRIEQITLAIAVNRKRLAANGPEQASQETIGKQTSEIERLAGAAAGLDTRRGDRITVSALDFVETPFAAGADVAGGLLQLAVPLAAGALKSVTVLGAVFLLIWFGLRPAAKALVHPALAPPQDLAAGAAPAAPQIDATPAGQLPPFAMPAHTLLSGQAAKSGEALGIQMPELPQKRLQRLVSHDADRATAVLKAWIRG